MKKFSVLSLVVALFAASTVVGQDDQPSPSDTPAVAPAVQADTAVEPQAVDATAVESSVMPMEPQIAGQVMNAPVMNNCCGAQVVNQPMVSQPCCGQTPAVNAGCNSCASPARAFRVRQLFRRVRVRGNCCCN